MGLRTNGLKPLCMCTGIEQLNVHGEQTAEGSFLVVGVGVYRRAGVRLRVTSVGMELVGDSSTSPC